MLHYLLDLTNDEQKQRWLPGFAAGELIGALAMTEPGAGSDLQGNPHHRPQRDGDDWILNGQKTFISSGIMADVVVVAARTNPDGGSSAFSLFVVERDTPGFVRGPQARQDRAARTGHLRTVLRRRVVPAANLLGDAGRGLQYLMSHLPRERLGVTAKAMATTRAIFDTDGRVLPTAHGIRSSR